MHAPSTKKNKEYQEKLPVVVLRVEEIMYSKANSEVISQKMENNQCLTVFSFLGRGEEKYSMSLKVNSTFERFIPLPFV